MLFLDFLFPKRCVGCGRVGSYVCKNCYAKIELIEKPVCPVCQRQALGGKTHPGCQTKYSLDGLVVAARYSGPVKKAIAKVKYRWAYDVGKILVDLVAAGLWKFDLPRDLILVPIPLHLKRLRWRGFNQAEILADLLSKKFHVRSVNFLKRTVNTRPQVGLVRDNRRKNIKGAFKLAPKSDLAAKNLMIVDDVFTSGATMAEAARVLKRNGAGSVWALAVALG